MNNAHFKLCPRARDLRFCSLLNAAIGLLALSAVAGSADPAPAKPETKPAPAASQPTAPEFPQSVFVVPGSLKEGRNPFFPNSRMGLQVIRTNTPSSIDTSAFVLNGITSPPKRTAMINGRTFEINEEGEVKLPTGGRVLVRCSDIFNDSAVIIVNGQRLALRLRGGA
jgi:hypothetical protein